MALLLGAEAKVKCPPSAVVGQPVLIDASESIGDLEWDTADPDVVIFTAIRGGKQAYVQRLSPGMARFWVRARDKDGTDTSKEVIPVSGDGPAPAPDPMPQPAPDNKPVKLPDGRYKIAQGTHDRAPRSERRKQEAEAVAKQLEQVRDKIKRGEVDPTNIAALKSEIRKATSELPTDVKHRWADWASWWGQFLTSLVLGGSVKTAADWVLLLEETILGLRAVT